MSLDAVNPTTTNPFGYQRGNDATAKRKTVTTPPPSSDAKPSDPPPSAASALDAIKQLGTNGQSSSAALLYQIADASTEEEMMQIINANPQAFLAAVFAWAKANGIKGKSTSQLINMFLGRLRSDMGFGSSTSSVDDKHLILLVGGDNRTNALVSVIGQIIYERYGEEAFKKYKARIEADWGDDGKLSEETLAIMDDVLSTEEANYKPKYDASGKLLNPPPEVRITRLYIELGQKYGGINPDKSYNDLEAAIHFETGKDLTTGNEGSAKTTVTNLLKAVQKWLGLEKALAENQRKYAAGEITKDEYLKTEAFLSAQLKGAKAEVTKAATAAGIDPAFMLQKATAQGFVLALTDPEAAARLEELGRTRAAKKGKVDQLMNTTSPGDPRLVKAIAELKAMDAEIAAESARLRKKGIDVSGDLRAPAGTGFADLSAGVAIVTGGGLDKAYVAETKAGVNPPPTWSDIFAKVDKLNAKRAQLAQVDADEKAGRITPAHAEAMRTKIKAEIKAMKAELISIADANKLPDDIFTNPTKEVAFRSVMVNPELGQLFLQRRNNQSEIMTLEYDISKAVKAGVDANDPSLVAKRKRVAELREENTEIERKIFNIMYNVDPAVAEAELDKKRGEVGAAREKYLQLEMEGADPAAIAAAKADWDAKYKELMEMQDRAYGPVTWPLDFDAYSEGAMAAVRSNVNIGWRIETDPAYRIGYAAPDVLTKEQLSAALSFSKSLDAAFADGVIVSTQ